MIVVLISMIVMLCKPDGVDGRKKDMNIYLGFPYGLKWVTRNLGADSPEDNGLYYAWERQVQKLNILKKTFDD